MLTKISASQRERLASEGLTEKVRALLINRPRAVQYKHISEACGITVTWLEKFARKNVMLPSCLQVEILHRCLTGKEINL